MWLDIKPKFSNLHSKHLLASHLSSAGCLLYWPVCSNLPFFQSTIHTISYILKIYNDTFRSPNFEVISVQSQYWELQAQFTIDYHSLFQSCWLKPCFVLCWKHIYTTHLGGKKLFNSFNCWINKIHKLNDLKTLKAEAQPRSFLEMSAFSAVSCTYWNFIAA